VGLPDRRAEPRQKIGRETGGRRVRGRAFRIGGRQHGLDDRSRRFGDEAARERRDRGQRSRKLVA
jgi:hypothetical protein